MYASIQSTDWDDMYEVTSLSQYL